MNYGRIIPRDVGNGPGIRVSLFVSGCTNNCPGCFNQEAQDFNYGDEYRDETEAEILTYIKEPYVEGLSILGGDPMCQSKLGKTQLAELCRKVRNDYHKTVWLWTGYTFDEILDFSEISPFMHDLLSNVDVMVDGQFVESQKDLTLKWRGSANQKIIDVQQSLERGEVVLYDE